MMTDKTKAGVTPPQATARAGTAKAPVKQRPAAPKKTTAKTTTTTSSTKKAAAEKAAAKHAVTAKAPGNRALRENASQREPVSKAAALDNKKKREPINRHNLSEPNLTEPDNPVAARLLQTRLRLNLSQAKMARRIVIFDPKPTENQLAAAQNDPKSEIVKLSGSSYGVRKPMTRPAYASYEKGNVIPAINVVEDMAAGLGVSPAWLAFGIEGAYIQAFRFDEETSKFVEASGTWGNMDLSWVPDDTVIFQAQHYVGDLVPGDAAIISKTTPDTRIGKYLIAEGSKPSISEVSQSPNGAKLRVYNAGDPTQYRDVEPGEISFLGKVIGTIRRAA